MSQRYDDDHLPHPDGCWVFHKDHERDLAALQRRVEEMEVGIRKSIAECRACHGAGFIPLSKPREDRPCYDCLPLRRLLEGKQP